MRVVLLVVLAVQYVSALLSAGDLQQHEDFVWYPNPDESGSFYPTFITQCAPSESKPTSADSDNEIKFFLYTRNDPNTAVELNPGKDSLSLPSSFNKQAPVKILVHGFLSSAKNPFPENTRKAYLELDKDINVIVVDWSELAKKRTSFKSWENVQSYFKVANNIVPVGQATAKLLNLLVSQGATQLNKIHFIGHGLGAHVAAVTANSLSIGKMGRVTGLNPERKGFKLKEFIRREYHLSKEAADFVDIIHSNGGKRNRGGMGLFSAQGHADFYPNGGRGEDCEGQEVLISTAKCKTIRAYQYWTESIGTKVGFKGCACESWAEYENGECACSEEEKVLMGEHCPVTARGKFYMYTNSLPPFAKG